MCAIFQWPDMHRLSECELNTLWYGTSVNGIVSGWWNIVSVCPLRHHNGWVIERTSQIKRLRQMCRVKWHCVPVYTIHIYYCAVHVHIQTDAHTHIEADGTIWGVWRLPNVIDVDNYIASSRIYTCCIPVWNFFFLSHRFRVCTLCSDMLWIP